MFKGQNDEMQNILTDILAGLRGKFVQPVLNENGRLLNMLEELKKQDREGIDDLRERVIRLEQKIEEIPLLVLSAIRDAINQATEGE
ncbi:hypothetical protein [Desulfoscipio gibsoniae]|uniref:Uncharacterized protein n=1 Tax=Desulfoscipio gibsoniae DSM 7213 TaxID=767817 RepID=R4KSW6_9FIRM|nr:hypothetical protein [Desulfoscipio gibsoniae]AGL02691.1 hypothetical protein Desgi_3346 [Desulfoscipio gibsoniae DSM 7213]